MPEAPEAGLNLKIDAITSLVTSPDGDRVITLPLGEFTNTNPAENGIKVATEVLARTIEALLAEAVLELPNLTDTVTQALTNLKIPPDPDGIQRIIANLHRCPRSRSAVPPIWQTNPHKERGIPSRDIRQVKVGPSNHRLVLAEELPDFNNAAGSPLRTDPESIIGPGVLLTTHFEVLKLEGTASQKALAAAIAEGKAPGFVLHLLRYMTIGRGGRRDGGVNPNLIVIGPTWTSPNQDLQNVFSQITAINQASSERSAKALRHNLRQPFIGGLARGRG